MIARFAAGMMMAWLPAVALAQMDVQNQRYTCDRAVQVPVVYANSADTSIAVLTVEGNQILLYSEISASGARYGGPSGGSNYVWLTKGADAQLLWRDGATKTETILLGTCKQN